MQNRKTAVLLITGLLLGCVLFGSGCASNGNGTNETRTVKAGDTVKVDYIGRLEDGKVFDTSIAEVAKQEGIYVNNTSYAPLTFKAGSGQMIKGFDEAVIGMKVGEEKNVTIPPEEAYGEHDNTKVVSVPIKDLNMSETPKVGQIYRNMYGNQFKVVAVNDTHVTVDANHELAGKTLIFNIKLVSIEQSTGQT